MNLFETIILNIVLISYPLILYSFYLVHNKNIGKKENQLFFDFALVSSLYSIIKFGVSKFYGMPIMMINSVLLIAYYKKRNISVILISILLIMYYHIAFKFSLIFLIIEYLIYMITYLFVKNKNFNIYIIIFIILKGLWLLYFMNSNYVCDDFSIAEVTIMSLTLLLTIEYIIFLNKKSESILKYHMTMKDLEQEKQIRSSLFKITHEIKNPIAVCKGYLDMFDVNNVEHSRKYVPVLREEIERLLLLLEDFLSIRQLKLKKEIMDINYLLEDISEKYETAFENNNIIFELLIKDDEVYIEGDYNRLIQLFINIIKNSIEALENIENKKIIIEEEILENDVKIVISDNGIGMGHETYKRFEEPFYTTKPKGTGLGVSLSKEIINSHNGTMRYESIENVGTRVIITIPKYKIKE